MSSASLTPTLPARATMSNAHASFLGLWRGELRKIMHMRITWVMAAIITLFAVGLQILLLGGNNKAQLQNDPLGFFYLVLEGDLSFLRVFSGIFLLVLAAHVVGLEYQHGTIRILLGRGIGRLQLLAAKVAALATAGLALLAIQLLIELAFAALAISILAEGHHPWSVLHDEFWVDVRYYLLYLLINAAVTLLLGVAASVLGRSLAFGLTVGLSWFAVDNLALIPFSLLSQLTHNAFWGNLSGLSLGLILNRLPDYIAPPYHVIAQGSHGPITVARPVEGFGMLPLIHLDGARALITVAAYSLIFAAVAIVLTRRDVLE
ncbi:MAG: ABC transporter permease subunit [Ktedonobacterales bacterium]